MERLQHYKTALESQFVVLDDFLGQGYWGLSMLMEMVMIKIMLVGPSSGHGLDLGHGWDYILSLVKSVTVLKFKSGSESATKDR